MMQKIIIADSNEEFSVLLAGALRSRFLVETIYDGALLAEHLRKSRPDILVLDLMLPSSCGLSLLKMIKRDRLCSAVVVTARFFSDHILDSLSQYPVAFAVQKPCPIDAITEEIKDVCNTLVSKGSPQSDPHCIVSSMLLALNLGTHKKGFTYCRESILMLAEDPSLQVTKEVYPVLAKACGTTGTAVEKAIRAAIDKAWANRNEDMWRLYFLPAPNGTIPKPTNTQFLTRLSDALLLEQRAISGEPVRRVCFRDNRERR